MPSHRKVGVIFIALAGVTAVVNAAPIAQGPLDNGVPNVLPFNKRLPLAEVHGVYHGKPKQ